MDSLPDEIIAQILSLFHPVYEDLSGYSIICRRWDRIIQNTGLLWKHIHLHEDRDAKEMLQDDYAGILCNCLRRYRDFIQCIKAEDQSLFIRPELRRLLPSLPNLKSLNVPVLSWSRVFAQSLECAPVLKSLTIDDYRALVRRRSNSDNARARIHKRGIRMWDLRVLARKFTSLESLTLNISAFKLYRHCILPVLDQFTLKELHLECAPYGVDELSSESVNCLAPIKSLMNSRHASTLVSLDLHYLPVTTDDLVCYVGNFKRLKQLFVGVSVEQNVRAPSHVILKSESLTTLFLTGLPSTNIKALKCVMPNLEVLLISECHNLVSLEVHAMNILSLILQGSCVLTNIKADCKSMHDFLMYECPSIEPEVLQSFLANCPYIKQMELSVVGWEVIELARYNCRSLRQLIIRDVTMSLSKLKVDCPTLEYFKCSGDVSPAKQKNSRSVAGCDIEIHAKSLRKFQMCDVGSANRVTLSCIEANVIQITGIQPWRRPLCVELKASRLIDTISLKGVTIGMIYIKSTSVENVIIEKCSLAGNSKNSRTMRFRCDEIRALRLLRCPRMKRFSLHVKSVQNLSIDSCANLRHLDVSASRLCHVRIDNCPYLEQIHEAISHHSSDFSLSHFSNR